MIGDYSYYEFFSILGMQGFAGLILFSVFVLMALGLAIIFGQMGVINMAHGEFMILGAYVTYFTSQFFENFLPALFGIYFFIAMILAFIVSGALGIFIEWSMIRHLYKRPLDTLLPPGGSASSCSSSTGPFSAPVKWVSPCPIICLAPSSSPTSSRSPSTASS
jgi:urea transport system permease protein